MARAAQAAPFRMAWRSMVLPLDASTVWATVADGGLWHSADGALSWQHAIDTGTVSVWAIVGSVDGCALWAVVGSDKVSRSLRSEDGCGTWREVSVSRTIAAWTPALWPCPAPRRVFIGTQPDGVCEWSSAGRVALAR